jgi:RAD51-like protein 1
MYLLNSIYTAYFLILSLSLSSFRKAFFTFPLPPSFLGTITMDKPLHRTQLSDAVADALNKIGIHKCGQLFQQSEVSLCHSLDLPLGNVRDMLDTVAKSIAPRPEVAWDILMHKRNAPAFLSTQLGPLDRALHGGIPAGTVTELVGRAGVGKTQMCLTLAALAAVPNLESAACSSGVVYIDTEQKFDPTRLHQMVWERCRRRQDGVFRRASAEQLGRICTDAVDHVTVFTLTSCKELVGRLRALQRLVIEKNVKLLIVDSVAAVARQEYSSIVHRQAWLNQQASLLKYIAERFDIPVVVTNQVTTRLADDEKLPANLTPALGNTWSHCVNTRLFLDKVGESTAVGRGGEPDAAADPDIGSREIVHTMVIQKSPMAGRLRLNYRIGEQGITIRT